MNKRKEKERAHITNMLAYVNRELMVIRYRLQQIYICRTHSPTLNRTCVYANERNAKKAKIKSGKMKCLKTRFA